jgi:type IV pilus assembly protein PilA
MQREHLGARGVDTGEKGFTLIELMVVVLIIAILIAIAIPVFLGARTRANDRATQSDLRNGLTAEETVYTDSQKYYVNAAAVKAVEPTLAWGTKLLVQVGTNNDPGDTVCLSELSQSGSWFAIGAVATSSGTAEDGTFYNKSPTDPCTTDPAIISSWPRSW